MKTKKQVNKEKFDSYLGNYSKLRKRYVHFCTPSLLEYIERGVLVAQVSLGKCCYGMFETKEENDRLCVDEYFIWE